MTAAIEIAPDRFPVDPGLRRIADKAMAKMSVLDGSPIGSAKSLVERLTPWWARPPRPESARAFGTRRKPREVGPHARAMVEALPGVIDALAGAGHFSFEDGRLRIAVPAAYERTPLPRDRMLAAFAARMAARRVEGADRQAALATAFLNLRGLHALHRTDDGSLVLARRRAGDRAFLVPGGYRIDPVAGPVLDGGHLVIVDAEGRFSGRWAPRGAIAASFPEPERAVVTVDCRKLKAWRPDTFSVTDLSVTAIRNHRPIERTDTRQGGRHVTLEPNWKGVESGRADAAAYLGFDIGGRHWNSFCGSLRRGRRLSAHVARLVLGMVEADVRRACLRSPRATVALANWFVEAGAAARDRRLQASAAYPVLTPYLHHVAGEIDAGRPLAPALTARLGLPPVLVRQLAGRTWQGMGKAFDRIVTTRERAGRLAYAIGVIPPERLPTSKAGWVELIAGTTILCETLGFPPASRLTRDASIDWNRTARVCSGRLADAYGALATVIYDACAHALPPRDERDRWERGHRVRMRGLVTRAVVGRDGGLGRLARLDERFHRDVARLRSEHDEIRREGLALVAGDDPAPSETWLPLTAVPFLGGGGSIAWITDSRALAEEGREMAHCVAWRDGCCRRGRSHIGRVTGADGGRSTVEFHLASRRTDGDALSWTTGLTEHQGRRNRPPFADCRAVVEAFLAEAGTLVETGPIIEAGDAHAKWEMRRSGAILPPGHALRILRLYEGLLDPAYRDLTGEAWIALVEEALARPLPAPPATCTLGDAPDDLLVGGPKALDGF